MKYRFGLLEEESRHEGKEYDYKIVVLISTILVTNVLMISTSAAQDKTSGFNNKVPESTVIPDKVDTRVDDLTLFDGSGVFAALILEVQ